MGFNKNAKQAGRLILVQKVLFLMMEVDQPGPFVSGMVGQALKENNVDPEPGDEEGKKDVLKTKLVSAHCRRAKGILRRVASFKESHDPRTRVTCAIRVSDSPYHQRSSW